ncbi:MAG: hypothetical protein WKF77_25455 [Planctomycetaceae bacterium]
MDKNGLNVAIHGNRLMANYKNEGDATFRVTLSAMQPWGIRHSASDGYYKSQILVPKLEPRSKYANPVLRSGSMYLLELHSHEA